MPWAVIITVHQCKNLRKVTTFTTQDPYFFASLGRQKYKSKTHEDGGSAPVWEQELAYDIDENGGQKEQVLHILVKDENVLKDKDICRADIPLSHIARQNGPSWYEMMSTSDRKKKAGLIKLTAVFRGTSNAGQSFPGTDANKTNTSDVKVNPNARLQLSTRQRRSNPPTQEQHQQPQPNPVQHQPSQQPYPQASLSIEQPRASQSGVPPQQPLLRPQPSMQPQARTQQTLSQHPTYQGYYQPSFAPQPSIQPQQSYRQPTVTHPPSVMPQQYSHQNRNGYAQSQHQYGYAPTQNPNQRSTAMPYGQHQSQNHYGSYTGGQYGQPMQQQQQRPQPQRQPTSAQAQQPTPTPAPVEGPLPEGWIELESSGRKYYQNNTLQITQWERPQPTVSRPPPPAYQPSTTSQPSTTLRSRANTHQPTHPGRPAPAETVRSQSARQEWKCARCTFANRMSSSKCSMCMSPRSQVVTPAQTPARPSWQCSMCTFKNEDMQRGACEMCGTRR